MVHSIEYLGMTQIGSLVKFIKQLDDVEVYVCMYVSQSSSAAICTYLCTSENFSSVSLVCL